MIGKKGKVRLPQAQLAHYRPTLASLAALSVLNISDISDITGRLLGQRLIVLVEGPTLTPPIRSLLTEYYVGNVILKISKFQGTPY